MIICMIIKVTFLFAIDIPLQCCLKAPGHEQDRRSEHLDSRKWGGGCTTERKRAEETAHKKATGESMAETIVSAAGAQQRCMSQLTVPY